MSKTRTCLAEDIRHTIINQLNQTPADTTVCWAETESETRETVHSQWPNAALPGALGQE